MAAAIATQCEIKPKVVSLVLNTPAAIATGEVKKTGVFAVPGLCQIETKNKPAIKAAKRMMFGKEVVVKASQQRLWSEPFSQRSSNASFDAGIPPEKS